MPCTRNFPRKESLRNENRGSYLFRVNVLMVSTKIASCFTVTAVV